MAIGKVGNDQFVWIGRLPAIPVSSTVRKRPVRVAVATRALRVVVTSVREAKVVAQFVGVGSAAAGPRQQYVPARDSVAPHDIAVDQAHVRVEGVVVGRITHVEPVAHEHPVGFPGVIGQLRFKADGRPERGGRVDQAARSTTSTS